MGLILLLHVRASPLTQVEAGPGGFPLTRDAACLYVCLCLGYEWGGGGEFSLCACGMFFDMRQAYQKRGQILEIRDIFKHLLEMHSQQHSSMAEGENLNTASE